MGLRVPAAASVALGCAAALGCSGPSLEVLERPSPSFLEREGEDLVLDGRPYRFLSFVAYTLTGCGLEGEVPDDAALDAFFSSLRPRSLVRTLAYEAWGLEGVERALRSASNHGHMLTLVLADDAGECADGDVKKTADWYATGFRDSYLPWVRTVVSRFKDDPAVGMWEPIKGAMGVDALTLRTFFDVVGGEIRELDDNHLVQAGIHGPWAYGDAEYRLIVESAGIDVATFHDYDNVSDVPPNLEPTLVALDGVGKPVILVEAGMFAGPEADPTQQNGGRSCISWADRRATFERQLGAAFATRLSGAHIWAWFPNPITTCAFGVSFDDPLVELVRELPIE